MYPPPFTVVNTPMKEVVSVHRDHILLVVVTVDYYGN